MKRLILIPILIIFVSNLFSQSITIGEDGIVRCKDVPTGTTQTIFGDTYEVVDRNLLMQRRDEGKDLTKVCVSNVSNMSYMFDNMNFNQPIGNWDVSNVVDMKFMFQYSAFNQPIGNWDVSKVTDMTSLFKGSTNFNQPIEDWDVRKVRLMNDLFFQTSFNQPIGSWDVSSVTSMYGMFYDTPFNQPIGDWDVSNVIDMDNMFTRSQFNQPIGNWQVSNVEDMSYMFHFTSFNQPIGNWDVGKVVDMNRMFSFSKFNHPIGDWDVSNVSSMSAMFMNSTFNQHIRDWDVSNVSNMTFMFRDSNFNRPINSWCVISITTEPSNFSHNSSLTDNNKPFWGTCLGLPPKLTQLNPNNNSIDVIRTVQLSWEAETNSTKYHIQVFEGSDPIVIDTLITDNNFLYSKPYKDNFIYNWRVRGINEDRKMRGEFMTGEWSDVWKFTTLLDTSIDIDEQPTQYTLMQNYPNPFNPTTRIQFSIPNSTHVQLKVYSILGQLISVLMDETMSSGNHSIIFSGESLSSGVYVYRLTTSEYTQSRIMNLLK